MKGESLISWSRLLNLLFAAAGNLIRNLSRSIVILLCLVAALFPFFTGVSISEGIKFQSKITVEEGADFYVAGDAAGRNVPLPLSQAKRFQSLARVSKVVPRIVGRAYLREKIVTVVGIPSQALPPSVLLAEGQVFRERGEVIVGSTLSRYFGLKEGVGFSLPSNKWKRLRVVGIFSSYSTIWSSNLLFMSFEDASEVFKMQGMATDFLIYAEPGYRDVVDVLFQIEKKANGPGHPPLRVQSKELVWQYFQRGFDARAGIFTVFFIVVFSLAIPAILIASGFGWSDRRKEIGVFKVTGWQTWDVMQMVAWENLLLSLTGSILTLLLSFIWIKAFNGFFISQFFIAESGFLPDFPVPSRFLVSTVFLCFSLSLLLTMTGSLYVTWRTATIPPAEAMR